MNVSSMSIQDAETLRAEVFVFNERKVSLGIGEPYSDWKDLRTSISFWISGPNAESKARRIAAAFNEIMAEEAAPAANLSIAAE